MSNTEAFIAHLEALNQRNRGALAALRHSLAFAPGSDPRAYPYVERFAGNAAHERDARRLALYAVAGLYALHPQQATQSLGSALGELYRDGSGSIEGRFIALLGADPENIVDYLRQAISLLAAKSLGLDYGRLLDDLSQWMNPHSDPGWLRQRWARDFYRAAQPTPAAPLETA